MMLNRRAVQGSITALLLAMIAPNLAQSPYPLATPPRAVTPDPDRPLPALVIYVHGQLTLHANNTSLPQLLKQISRATGIRVTGSTREERVFGSFGPDSPEKILAMLLQGTGTNMLITQGYSGTGSELILTPQNGPATAPPPESDQPAQFVPPVLSSQGSNSTSRAAEGVAVAAQNINQATDAAGQPQQPAPLTSMERAQLVDRLQQQQRQAASPAQPH